MFSVSDVIRLPPGLDKAYRSAVTGNLPWEQTWFSQQMLEQHLDQTCDNGSRRLAIIKQQVEWIEAQLLPETEQANIVDLACGPGFYCRFLAKRGHHCLGIDCSPAAINYAEKQPDTGIGGSNYILADFFTFPFEDDYDLAMLLFGEFNEHDRQKMRRMLCRLAGALRKKSGRLLIEYQNIASLAFDGRDSSWSRHLQGPLCSEPHLLLKEGFWLAAEQRFINRYHIIEENGRASCRQTVTNGYSEDQLQVLLTDCGFNRVDFYPFLTDSDDQYRDYLSAAVAYV